jgi:hypothetical protein
MARDGGVALDVFEGNESPMRGLGAIWVDSATVRQPLPLAGVAIDATVADRIAQVTVTQVFRNTFTDPIEAVYTFPLDGGSVVSHFEMQVGERTLRGIVKERGAARREYQQALDGGRRGAAGAGARRRVHDPAREPAAGRGCDDPSDLLRGADVL